MMIGVGVEQAVSEHLPQGVVLVRQFVQPVVVAVQRQPDDTQNKHRPQGHSRAAGLLVHCRGYFRLKQDEQFLAGDRIVVNLL